MDFLVIIPAYNEEDFIRYTLDSILDQTHKPKKVIVVNDGSTDRTAEIVEEYIRNNNWMELVNKPDSGERESGEKVVRTFNFGLDKVDLNNFDVIVKLDADLSLPSNYFDKIMKIFIQDPKVGIAGGVCQIENDGRWLDEDISNNDHVRGAIKSYRRNCLKDIKGLRECQGWDAIDEYIARMKGWNIIVNNDLKVLHHRKTNAASNWMRINLKNGASFYLMRYGFVLSFISCLKRGIVHKPYMISGCVSFIGYLIAVVHEVPFRISKTEGYYIRNYRYSSVRIAIKKILRLGS